MPTLPEIGSSLPEVALRTAIVYLFLIHAMRLSGKRELGRMSVLETDGSMSVIPAGDRAAPASNRPPGDRDPTS